MAKSNGCKIKILACAILVSSLVSLSSGTLAFAGTPDGAKEIADAAGAAVSSTATSSAATTGISADKQTLGALRETNDLCHHIKQAGKDLLYECQQADMAYLGTPNYLGMAATQTNTLFSVSPLMGNFLPPRKKWVIFYMSHLAQLMPDLKEQINSIAPPPSITDGAELVSDMKNEYTNLDKFYAALVNDAKADPYSNAAISRDAEGLNLIADRIDKDRKDLEKEARHVEKEDEKALKQK